MVLTAMLMFNCWVDLVMRLQVLKRTVQTAVVWTLYEELVPRLTTLAEAFAHPSQGSSS